MNLKSASRCWLHQFLFAALALCFIIGARADEFSRFSVAEFTFIRPADWQWVIVTSSMRKAQLKVNEKSGTNSADVVFFQFGPGAAGGVEANIERWYRQFSEPREKINATTNSITVDSTKITFVGAEGTYNSGMPGTKLTPMPGFALLGAIIESEAGNVFVRMTGPKNLVNASTAEFKKMITGLKKS